MIPSSFAQPNGYDGGVIETYQHNLITGDFIFSVGDSKYKGELSTDANYSVDFDTIVPKGSTIKVARMYLYWTWSYNGSNGTYPKIEVQSQGNSITPDKEYTDRKGYGNYDYPSGTYAYDVIGSIASDKFHVTVTNTGIGNFFSINGAGLILIYEHPDKQLMWYWINEGADIIRADSEDFSEKVSTKAYFEGEVDTSNVSSAQLITIVPSGDKGKNMLGFNSMEWEGVYGGYPYEQLAMDYRDVTNYLLPRNNSIEIRDKGDYLIPSNAFLFIKASDPSPDQNNYADAIPGFGVMLLMASFFAVVCLFEYVKKE